MDKPLNCSGGAAGKESACRGRRHRFDPWLGKTPWSRKWQSTPVCLPEKSHGQRSLVEATIHGVTERLMQLSTHWLPESVQGVNYATLLQNTLDISRV